MSVATGARTYRRGYTPPAHLRGLVAAAHRTNPVLTFAAAGACHLLLVFSLLGPAWTLAIAGPVPGVLAGLAGLAGYARAMRGLECLVHEGSHFNWVRRTRWLNDLLTVTLAGLPSGLRLSAYRSAHLVHHGRFGTWEDPEWRRYQELNLAALPRHSPLALLRGVYRRLFWYQRTVTPASWAAVAGPSFCGLALTAVSGLSWGPAAAVLSSAVWLAGFLLVLPAVRLAGEASEHSYTGTATLFAATWSNLGPWHRLLVHPHGDGHHALHHLWPGVPHHRLPGLHRALLAADPGGYGRELRYRTRMLTGPAPLP
ncbi:fatty acid desaturase [Longispora albida]|uniref:fatty acid desaturase n=1 Tax=Longispora albida TaxID=203523 RepID=UPI00036FDAC7|nr:fatty acid desaturase [Longispora albida]